jgi:hypothetical protein
VIGFWQQMLDDVRRVAGLESGAVGTAIPLTDDHSRTDITVEGTPLPRPGSFRHPDCHILSPGYEKTLGIRLLRGRLHEGKSAVGQHCALQIGLGSSDSDATSFQEK